MTEQERQYFEATFPQAAAFLTRSGLRGELGRLRRWAEQGIKLGQWETRRLAELEETNRQTGFMEEVCQ